MISSAQKGNLANAGIVLDREKTLESSESLVVSRHDATAHAERLLVQKVCNLKKNNYTPGLTMVTVCEPCLMCMSACAWAGYKKIAYIIPAQKYISKIPWMSENTKLDKDEITQSFTESVELIQISEYENEFSKIFELQMANLLR